MGVAAVVLGGAADHGHIGPGVGTPLAPLHLSINITHMRCVTHQASAASERTIDKYLCLQQISKNILPDVRKAAVRGLAGEAVESLLADQLLRLVLAKQHASQGEVRQQVAVLLLFILFTIIITFLLVVSVVNLFLSQSQLLDQTLLVNVNILGLCIKVLKVFTTVDII